jgi:hypothetical protein
LGGEPPNPKPPQGDRVDRLPPQPEDGLEAAGDEAAAELAAEPAAS